MVLHVMHRRIDEDLLRRGALREVIPIHAAPSFYLAEELPVGGAITDAGEAARGWALS